MNLSLQQKSFLIHVHVVSVDEKIYIILFQILFPYLVKYNSTYIIDNDVISEV